MYQVQKFVNYFDNEKNVMFDYLYFKHKKLNQEKPKLKTKISQSKMIFLPVRNL